MATMTLNMPEKEMLVLEEMAVKKDMSKTQIMRQALRLYQLVDVRLSEGETMHFSGDDQRKMKVILT